MDDKRLRDKFNNSSSQQLIFSKEDRNEVFEEIRKMEKNHTTKKKMRFTPEKFIPLTVSILAIGLCMILLLPSLSNQNFAGESGKSTFNQEANTSVTSATVAEGHEFSTSLITVKSKQMGNRVYLNLLLTYNKEKKMVKVVSLPSDTYVPVTNNSDGTPINDKLLFAYQFGGAENVKNTVSKFLDIPIDYYAVIDIETVSKLIDSENSVNYDLPKDIQVRAISQAAFEFKKGKNSLNGEQVVSLMMVATEGTSLDEGNLENLMNAVFKKTEVMPPAKLQVLFSQIETNTTLDSFIEDLPKISTIKSLPISDGMIDDTIILGETEGKHIYKFEEDFLNSLSEDLTKFN